MSYDDDDGMHCVVDVTGAAERCDDDVAGDRISLSSYSNPSAMMDACSRLLAAPSYGLGFPAGPFDAFTFPWHRPKPKPLRGRCSAAGRTIRRCPTRRCSDTGLRRPSRRTPPAAGLPHRRTVRRLPKIAVFGPPPPQRSNLSAFYPGSNAGVSGNGSTGDATHTVPHTHIPITNRPNTEVSSSSRRWLSITYIRPARLLSLPLLMGPGSPTSRRQPLPSVPCRGHRGL